VLLLGLFLFALGLVLTLQSGLGLGPWDALHQGLSLHAPVTFGQAGIAVGFGVLALTLLLREPVGLGTVLNMVLVGLFIDLILWAGVVPDLSHTPPPVRFLADAGGVATVGLGSALYIGAGLGAGPRDSLMLGLARLTGWRVGVVRAGIELSVLAVGYLLGGTIGVGTLIFAFGIGPAVELAFRLLGAKTDHG
jgi:uncharacterized membrane protein YczE